MSAELRAALERIPPGPYTVQWPDEQGGRFVLWGKQGTPPDFKDGWAIPLVASGVDTCMFALRDILTGLSDPATLATAMSAAYKSVGSWNDFDDAVLAFAEATLRELSRE